MWLWDVVRGLGFGILLKAAFMSLVATLLDIGFVKSLLLVLASACASGLFGIYITRISVRSHDELHARLDNLEAQQTDIAGSVGVQKRRTDPPPPPPPSHHHRGGH